MSGPPPYTPSEADHPPPSRWGGGGGYKGYEPVTKEMDDYPPTSGPYRAPQQQPPPPTGYAPAPTIFSPQQQTSNNVVVVGQQPSAPPPAPVIHMERPSANTHLALTVLLMFLCFFHGNLPAFVFLVPALICACAASDHNSAGDYEGARSCGHAALCCNVISMVYFLFLVLVGIACVAVTFTIGWSFLGGEIPSPVIVIPTPTFCTNFPFC